MMWQFNICDSRRRNVPVVCENCLYPCWDMVGIDTNVVSVYKVRTQRKHIGDIDGSSLDFPDMQITFLHLSLNVL